jgi:bifunctional DNase/RNase
VAAPIFVEEEVVRKAKSVEVMKETEVGGRAEDPQKIKEWLDSIKPADFGKIEKKDPGKPDE